MKDLSDRFSAEAAPLPQALRADPLARLQAPVAEGPEQEDQAWSLSSLISRLRDRADVLAGASMLLAAGIVLWPHVFPDRLHIPPVAETTTEVATLTVRPLLADAVWAPPDWYGLFNVYQLETTLRDISIRCNYGLPSDGRVDHYLHARLQPDSKVRIYLADPGRCPKV